MERIQDGGAGEMHDEMAALALAVVDGLTSTFSHAVKRYTEDATQIERVHTASKHLHTWVATAARLLQWRVEHPDGGGKALDYEAMIKDKGNDDSPD